MEQQQHTIVIAIITNDKNEILLAKRHEPESEHTHGKWEFVGGGMEFGEKPEDAVKREAREEAGVEIKIVRLLPKVFSNLWKFDDGRQQQIIMLSYECKIVDGVPTPNLGENIGELKFVSIDEIKNMDTLPQLYEMAKMILSQPLST
jgi:mutator protein MutT